MKFFILFLCVSIFSLSVSSWVYLNSWVQNYQEPLDMQQLSDNYINKIIGKFCNDGFTGDALAWNLSLNSRPGQKQNVCFALANTDVKNVKLSVSMVDGHLNDVGHPVCDNSLLSLSTGAIVSDFLTGATIFMSGHDSLVKYFAITVPEHWTWEHILCVAYQLSQDSIAPLKNSMFQLVVRKVAPMRVTVSGSVYHFQWFDDVSWFVLKYKRSFGIPLLILVGLLLLNEVRRSIVTSSHPKKHKKKL